MQQAARRGGSARVRSYTCLLWQRVHSQNRETSVLDFEKEILAGFANKNSTASFLHLHSETKSDHDQTHEVVPVNLPSNWAIKASSFKIWR